MLLLILIILIIVFYNKYSFMPLLPMYFLLLLSYFIELVVNPNHLFNKFINIIRLIYFNKFYLYFFF
jgi:hypothetical protein